MRRAAGPLRFEITGFYTKFNGFIFRRLTGNTCEDGACQLGPGPELNQALYSQRTPCSAAANSRASSISARSTAASGASRTSSTSSARPSPTAATCRGSRRCAPAAIYWRDANWLMRVNLLHAFAQTDVAPIAETPTHGYNLLKAEVSYKTKLDPS